MRAVVVFALLELFINIKTITMKKYLLSAFAIVALLFAACGGGDDAPTSVPVSGIKLDKSSLSLEIGEKATLTATIAPSDATNKSITWSSANSSIATVNNGVVEGVATGETTITAKTNDGGFTASATVKVTPEAVKVTQIKLVGVPTTDFEVGRSVTISAVITPNDATDKSVTFTSSTPEVATVEYTKTEDNYSLALLKAVGPGKATITATANDGSGVKAEAEIEVVSATPTAVTFDGQSKDKTFLTWHGKEVDLKTKVEPSSIPFTSLNWSYYTWTDGGEYFSLNVTKDKATAVTVIPTEETNPQDIRTNVSIAKDSNSVAMAQCTVVSRCNFWACYSTDGKTIGNEIMILHFGPTFFHQESYFRWDATGTNTYKNGWYFVAACPPLTYQLNAALSYYKDSYIPTSEYTLTSSSANVKITKTSEKLYKVERTQWDTYEELTLTYTCGDYVYNIPVKLIP